MESPADRLARGEEITPEEYEEIAKDRTTPVVIDILRSTYNKRCGHCGSMVSVFECSIPLTGQQYVLCLHCQDAIRSKKISVDTIGQTYAK